MQIRAISSDAERFEVIVVPEQSYSLFDFNGADLGREVLKNMPVVKQYEAELQDLSAVPVPGHLNIDQTQLQWPMTKEDNLPGGVYVWVSPDNGNGSQGSDTGNVAWKLQVPEGGSYYVWAEVLPFPSGQVLQVVSPEGFPEPSVDIGTNSLLMRVYQELDKPLGLGTSLISCRNTTDWQCIALAINQAVVCTEPTLLKLPKGEVLLQLFSQTSGLKIRKVFVSDNLKVTPQTMGSKP